MNRKIVLHGIGSQVILMRDITKPVKLPFGTRATVGAVRYYEDHLVSPQCVYDLFVDGVQVNGIAPELLVAESEGENE